MKKIGIVTLYYKNYNYGGQLQAYAMQKLFSQKDSVAQLISFQINSSKYGIRRVKKIGIGKTLTNGWRKICFFVLKTNRSFKEAYDLKIKRFDDFMAAVPHTKLFFEDNIQNSNPLFDMFVCGSDQVWNPGWWNDILLLKFTEKPRFSYAASIGLAALRRDEESILRDALRDYRAISVREKQAKEMLEKIVKKKVEFVLDPTLLIEKEEWEKIAVKPDCNEKYVLFYMVGNAPQMKKTIYEKCKTEGKTVVAFAFSRNTYFSAEQKYADIFIYDAGPREWLGWFQNAECVFTNSFHGTVFSVVFGKKFLCFEQDAKEDRCNENSRLYSLLEITGMEDRMLSAHNQIADCWNRPIHYEYVEAALRKYSEISHEFINGMI